MRKTFYGSTVIKDDGALVLSKPLNSWDMNYHLYDTLNNIEYLIDIDDVGSNENDLENCLILYDDLLNLDLNYLLEYSWKKLNY